MLENTLLFLDISGGEFLVILLVAFFVFGPKKLPEIARKLGRTMNEIKSVSGELTKEFRDETRNITQELRTARESARINTEDLNIDKILEPETKNNKGKPDFIDNSKNTASSGSGASLPDNNNVAGNVVNREKEINI